MSETTVTEQEQAPIGAESPSVQSITVQGQAPLRTAISMVFSDILSQELVQSVTSPEAISLIQGVLQKKEPQALQADDLKPMVDKIPNTFMDVVRETIFCSGALVKELDCEIDLKVGESFRVAGPKKLAVLEVRDGRLTAIRPIEYQ